MLAVVAQWFVAYCCRCQTLLSDFDCDRIFNSHAIHHKSCPALLSVCGTPAQGQLAGLLSNGSASQGMGPPSMLPPHHGGPLHPQDWMAQPHMNGQMNGLMPSPQSGPHPNMQDSRYVILQDTSWRITLACKLLCVSIKTCQGKTHLMLKRTLFACIFYVLWCTVQITAPCCLGMTMCICSQKVHAVLTSSFAQTIFVQSQGLVHSS